jgi:hypothetical protein
MAGLNPGKVFSSSGGEGEIRTHVRPGGSASCRFDVAADAKIAINAVDHCPVLPGDNLCPKQFGRPATFVSRVTCWRISLQDRSG